MRNNKNEIRIPMHGGYLIATASIDPDYPGICVMFETNEGTLIDVVYAETKAENEKKKIDVYCYENAYNEDFTRKYTLNVKDIYEAISEEYEEK